jgi:hypothetical protein
MSGDYQSKYQVRGLCPGRQDHILPSGAPTSFVAPLTSLHPFHAIPIPKKPFPMSISVYKYSHKVMDDAAQGSLIAYRPSGWFQPGFLSFQGYTEFFESTPTASGLFSPQFMDLWSFLRVRLHSNKGQSSNRIPAMTSARVPGELRWSLLKIIIVVLSSGKWRIAHLKPLIPPAWPTTGLSEDSETIKP